MIKSECPFNAGCKGKCPTYKVQCIRFCQRYTLLVLNKIGYVKVVKLKSPITVPGVYATSSTEVLVGTLLATLQKSLRAVKVYHFSTAIDAAINCEEPSEPIIVIDTTNKYKEVEKGMQAISSFAQKLAATKIVLLKVVASKMGEEVKQL